MRDDTEITSVNLAQWPPGSYGRAAIDNGLEGVACLMSRRTGRALAPMALERCKRDWPLFSIKCDGVDAVRRWLRVNLPVVDVEKQAHVTVAQLDCLPLLALALVNDQSAYLTGELWPAVRGLVDDLEALRQRSEKGSPKVELARYSRAIVGVRPRRGPSPKSLPFGRRAYDAMRAEWAAVFVPPDRTALLALLDAAISESRWAHCNSELLALRALTMAGAEWPVLVKACESLSFDGQRALEASRLSMWMAEPSAHSWLFTMSNEVSAEYARRAACKRAGHASSRADHDAIAARLLDLHAKLHGRETWVVTTTMNRVNGNGVAFIREALRLYGVPAAWTSSAHWVRRARALKLESKL